MDNDLDKQFKTFLTQKENYFTTVEEEEEYQYNIQGLNDHTDDILKLIFGESELTELHKLYRKRLLRSFIEGFKDSNEDEHSDNYKDDSEPSRGRKFDAVLNKHVKNSLK